MSHIEFFTSASDYFGSDLSTTLTLARHREKPKPELNKQAFNKLAREWVARTKYASSLNAVVSDKAYRDVVAFGWDAVPFIIEDLRRNPKPWFVALREITGDSPIAKEDAGDFRKMTAAWLDWAERKGY